ncbi:T9SS type B sorting domain-containing protein [Tamlana sp. 2201CG12-4]|uniref:T9SS type B sorting domain-containing protein n=1 Tax=Tamlana sp. 2201CG12-4 TaxID=3112582 RepID=UPI002DBC21B6|nr:T9SS type B sorting domain-containing protein [Tamlana sp. 2201CG12-4]MEC3908716.1 T9SS type B sorting domain-containing protein [Tamlana sp. 2201CG12-4]
MKKPACLNKGLVVLMLVLSIPLFSQNLVPFAPRYDEAIKGDMLLIGNSNVGIHVSDPYNGTNTNDRLDAAVHVDIDGDSTTFNSSSADLDVPSDTNCYQIVYAGLYWSSVVNGSTPMSDIKFKTPGGSYIDITGTQIYFQNASNNVNSNTYAYYHDVTSILSALPNPEGTYTVANISSMVGPKPNSEGLSAGWSLFVIYEDPLLPSQYITSFDGFTKITSSINETFPVTGFRTIPTGPVRAKYAFSTIEGDRRWTGDYLLLNGTTVSATNNAGTVIREGNNFFNSTSSIIDPVTNTPELLTARNPNGSNTLGFDSGIINIPNAGNTVIANGATSATISLGSNLDIYYFYFNAFAIEIIAPNIVLTKIVEDEFGNNIEGQVVDLGDQLYYTIGLQNTGNDDATDLTIRDVLPTNIVFDYPTDIEYLPPGVTVESYDPATRELVFRVNRSVVEENDPVSEIRFKVTVVSTCSLLSDACSNIIDNQAYSTYKGTINPDFTISDDPSYNTNTGCLITPGATNFLADLNDCTFEEEVILCGADVVLTAGSGYDSYSWSTSPTGTPVIGTTQSITVTETGTYYVHNSAIAPCQDTDQVFNVITFGANVTNPVIPFADQVVICPNDGKELPNIFLCGANDSRLIQTGITDTTSMIWEKLDETSCAAVVDQDCANEDPGCTWNQVASGPDFTADTAGQYRLTLNYSGGCFNQFYFNIYTNLLVPTVSSRDIYCTTPGEIVVGGVPSGYEYSLDGVNYQPSNTFTVTTANLYTVYIRQIGVSPNPCIFTVPDVQIVDHNFSVSTIITQPLCHGELGSIAVAANDVRPQYYFSISQGATVINSVGPIMQGDYTFSNLNPGTYTVDVSTEDGCVFSGDVEIIEPPLLEATVALTQPLTCTDGEITVYPTGGTPPYYYFVNSTTVFQSTPIIPVTAAGVYNITVVDSNNCSTDTSITVDQIDAPEFTVDKTDILCYGDNSGEIRFNVTNANGYTIEYSIDNGVTYGSNPTISNLGAGTYQTMIKYSLNGADCFSVPEDVIITQPDAAVTASAGVTELAGCGPGGEGLLRITNPQGGTAPYEYSFDNQATWSTTPEAYVMPGTYTLYIRDANGCIFPMTDITLDPEPVAPTIDISDPDFNCDGTANSTVTVNNTGTNAYTYTYLLDGVENTNTADPTTFLDVPNGSHTISVTYQLQTVPTYSNLLIEDFGSGSEVPSPGINPAFCFERQVEATKCHNRRTLGNGEYTVTNSLKGNFYGGWHNPVDHTSGSSNGRYMAVDAGNAIPNNAVLYRKTISDIIPNQPIQVRFFATNLLRVGNNQPDASLTVELQDTNGIALSSESTGGIPKTNGWVEYVRTINPGNNTSLDFVLRLELSQRNGIDFAVDDIEVFQLPVTCITQVDFPIVIESGNAFSAEVVSATDVTCNDSNDGSITISAQNFDTANGYQYSLDGVNWITQMTSPYTITGLTDGSYTVQIRYEDAVDTCEFTFNQDILTPASVDVSASATTITCLDDATVTATATGGTAAYAYELLDTSLNLVSNFPGSGILANVTAGDYIVRVTDANGCTDTTPLSLVNSTPPTATVINADYCYDGTNGATLEVSASGGQSPYEYNINGGAFQTSPSFTNLTPGNYDITVRDAYGCTFSLPTEIIETQVEISAVLTKELDCTSSPDAEITGTISNGYPPYTYEVSVNGGAFSTLGATGTPFTYTAASDGTYQFQVTDANGCQALSNVITVSPISFPTATTTVVNPSCNGDTNGSVQIVPADGVGPYEYSFNGSAFTTTSLYTGLSAGINYSYEVRDAKNCVFSGSVTLTEPTALIVSASATAFSCDAANTNQSAVVTVDLPTTGTAPYLYSFNGSGYSATNTFTVNDNGTDQTITYSVQDAQGCTAGGSVTLSQLDPPTDLDFVSTAITCLATTSTVTLTSTDGVGVLEYETIAPSPIIVGKQTSNVFSGLTEGTYVFRVTDANGCYYTESYTIDPVTPIAVTGLIQSDVLCQGGNTGAIEFTVYDTTGFSYTINGGASVAGTSPINLTNLTVGAYTIEVTDTTTGCTANETIIVSEPANALSFTTTATNINCNNDNAQITVTASGGTPAYTYAAVISGNPAPGVGDYNSSHIVNVDTNTGTDLNWDVYVKDANDCIEINTVAIIEDALPTVTAPGVANQCTVTSGFTFTVSTPTGVAPFMYSINGGASYQSSPTFTVNTPGSYTITVRDANGCTATSPTTTDVFAPITASAVLTKGLTCSGPTDANIDISVSGGDAPYTYEVSTNGGTTYTAIAGSPYTASTAGNYQFRITDANGCTRETNVVVVSTPDNPLITSVTQTQFILCSSEETAAINIAFDNTIGLAPFVINVNNDTTGTDYGTQTSGLAAGDYTITLTDANGCTDTETITIAEPTPVNLAYSVDPITCGAGGVSLGRIIIDSVSGGTPNYTYHVTGVNGYNQELLNQTGLTQVFEVVDFGLYEIIITDANGCTAIETNILVASPPDDLDININATADCITGGTAEVSIGTPLSGSGPYHFAIYTGPGMTYTAPTTAPWQDEDAPGSETSTFTGLIPGATYTFIVYDELTGCYYYEVADTPIPTNSTLTVGALTSNNITCTGSADGNVSFDITSIYPASTDVSYEIYNSLTLVTTGISGTTTIPANGTVSISNFGTLPFGEYLVLVEELAGATNAGCSVASTTFNITESAVELAITASSSKNENCNELGVISAVAQDGTAPYEYQLLLATDPAPSATSPGWGSANTFNASADSYIVYVKDAYNCIRQAAVTVIRDPEPTINPVSQQCFDGTPFTITLVEGTGTAIAPLTYSIGGAYQSSNTFTISTAGTYTVSVRDGNGCIATDTFVVEPPLLLDADLTQDLTCILDASITLNPNGGTGTYTTYEVNYNGGGYVAIGGSPYTTTLDGTYLFRVTDSQGCQAISNVVVVTPNTTPTFTYVQTNVSCNGGADGSIVITAANGIAPYQYSINNGATFQVSNVFTGLSAGAYDVVVRDSKNCDSLPVTVTITEPSPVSGSGTLTQSLTCGAGNATQPATVTITGSGGTVPYTYSFDGGANYTSTNTFTTNTSGTVTAYIQDANGCIITTPIDVVIPALDVPTDLDFVSTAVTCLALTSDVTLTATNGVGPLSYAIIAPASATGNITGASTGIFTGLTPDTYTFTVTDANGCYYTESYTVNPVTNITVSGLLLNDVSCNGGSDGAVEFTVGSFATTYSYTINGGSAITGQTAGTISLTGLAIGAQTIVVTDELTGCTDTVTVNVGEPTALILVEATNINAHCNFGAQVSVTATGGTPDYTYAFVVDGSVPIASDYTSSTSAILDPAISTDWDVWVMDSNGCTDQIDVVIATDPLPTISVPALAINQCNLTGDPYTFTVTGTTGIAPFTYSIGNGFQASPTFTVSTPGTYAVTVRDGNGCEVTGGTTITVYPALDLSAAITSLPSCSNDDGEITITGSGGSGNYVYSISPSPASVSIAGHVISGVPSGTFAVTIEDTTTLCTRTVNVTLDAATPVTFTTVPTDVSCNGGSDGMITVNLPASNDNPVYTYSLDGGVTTQTSNVFTGLIAGTYNITVTSGRNCTLTQSETVGEPNPVVIANPIVAEYDCTANTNATNYATITVNGVTGGSSVYTIYEFIRGGTVVQATANNVYTETDLLGGTYTINVYDDNGCSGSTTATIQPFIGLDALNITIDNAITCTNDEDITVSVTSTGGTPTNLEYTVEDVDGTILGAVYSQTNTTGVFTGLPIGNYLVTVVNLDTGCSLQTTHYVDDPNTFDLTIDNVVDVTCFNDSDGSVNVTFIDRVPTPSDESGAFTYNIVDALGNPVTSGSVANAGPVNIPGFAAGTYTITATLTNTPYCTVSKSFTISAPTAALAISETHTEITCIAGNNDGSISATATGGWPGAYEYQLELAGGTVITPFSAVPNFTNLMAGDYIVSVRDSAGCIAIVNVPLVNPAPIDAQAIATPSLVSCFGDTNASITVNNVTGGQGSNYTYILNMVLPTVTSSGPQTSPIFNGLGAGTYNVTVRDGYNCEFTTADVIITQPNAIQATLVKATSQTCTVDATLTLSAVGGTGSYEYSDDMAFSSVLGTFTSDVTFAVTPGTYMYYVRDANGCTSMVSNEITVDPLPVLTIDLDATNATINCVGDNTGVIVAEAQGGLGNYIYILQDASGTDITPAPTQNSPGVFTDLTAGTYQVRVTSGVDCEEVSAQVSITEPALALQASYTTTDVACNGGDDGIMEITATGGTGIIKYAISPQLNQFFESPIFENLTAGTYQAIAQDELGCFVLIDFTIDEPTPVVLSIVPNSIIPEVCSGDLNGAFSIDISGGNLPYSVSLDDIDGTYTTGGATQTQFDFDNLAGGDHIVYVRDNEGCESEWNITFPESVLLDPQVVVDYGCVNNLSTNTVTVSVDPSITNLADIDYSLNGGPYQTSHVFTDVPAGIGHYINVRHTNGCIKPTLDFDIDQVDPLELALEDGGLNEIVAATSGGVEPYEYTLNGEAYGSENTFIIYASGDYTVTVTDANGCVATATRFFEYIDVCIPNYFTPNGDGTLDRWGPGCTSQYKDLTFDIYDRYGRKIATLRAGDKWDGKYNGIELPTGDYWYVVKLNDPKDDREFVGHFTLYR